MFLIILHQTPEPQSGDNYRTPSDLCLFCFFCRRYWFPIRRGSLVEPPRTFYAVTPAGSSFRLKHATAKLANLGFLMVLLMEFSPITHFVAHVVAAVRAVNSSIGRDEARQTASILQSF